MITYTSGKRRQKQLDRNQKCTYNYNYGSGLAAAQQPAVVQYVIWLRGCGLFEQVQQHLTSEVEVHIRTKTHMTTY